MGASNPDNRPLCVNRCGRPQKLTSTGALHDRCGKCIKYRCFGYLLFREPEEMEEAPSIPKATEPLRSMPAAGQHLLDLWTIQARGGHTAEAVLDALLDAHKRLGAHARMDTVTVPVTIGRNGIRKIGPLAFALKGHTR